MNDFGELRLNSLHANLYLLNLGEYCTSKMMPGKQADKACKLADKGIIPRKSGIWLEDLKKKYETLLNHVFPNCSNYVCLPHGYLGLEYFSATLPGILVPLQYSLAMRSKRSVLKWTRQAEMDTARLSWDTCIGAHAQVFAPR